MTGHQGPSQSLGLVPHRGPEPLVQGLQFILGMGRTVGGEEGHGGHKREGVLEPQHRLELGQIGSEPFPQHDAMQEGRFDEAPHGLLVLAVLDLLAVGFAPLIDGCRPMPQGLGQLVLRDGLQEVVDDSQFDGFPRDIEALVGRHQDEGGSGPSLADLPDRIQARYPRHLHIHEDQVRSQRGGLLDGIPSGHGLPGNLELSRQIPLDHEGNPLDDWSFIIHHQNPLHFPPSSRGRWMRTSVPRPMTLSSTT